jgi:hypothetical protein
MGAPKNRGGAAAFDATNHIIALVASKERSITTSTRSCVGPQPDAKTRYSPVTFARLGSKVESPYLVSLGKDPGEPVG